MNEEFNERKNDADNGKHFIGKPTASQATFGNDSDGFGKSTNNQHNKEITTKETSGITPDASRHLGTEVVKNESTFADVDAFFENEFPQLDAVDKYFATGDAALNAGDPPLLTRKEKQARKGLPTLANLRKLARTWLEEVHELWPDVAKAGLIPPLNDDSVETLVRDFVRRFINGIVEEFVVDRKLRSLWKMLAEGYFRYSCDNSNPRSLDDQLRKALRKAKEHGRFMPWHYVFADASVTARTHLRRGYRLAKEAMEKLKDTELETLYIDDFGRATRDAVESYRLAKLLQKYRKGLIGVSDGFDLEARGSEVVLMAHAMFNEMFINQLREKVMRGMKGAAARGTSLGRPRFGFHLVPQKDKDGNVVMNEAKGRPIYVVEIDPENMGHMIQAARWFGEENRSYSWIARQFNAAKIDARNNWKPGNISQMLACPLYIGVSIFNRTRTVYDGETGEFKVVPNPNHEWIIKIMPQLRAWPDELWKKVRRRAAFVRRHHPCTGKTWSPQVYPAALLTDTLVCGYCKCGIRLVRSDLKRNYRQYGCPNGCEHLRECKLQTSKSVRIVDECVLKWLDTQVLTPERIRQLVIDANFYLLEEAKRPRISTQPIKDQIKAVQAAERKLTTFILKHQDDHNMNAYLTKGDQLRQEIRQLQDQLGQAMAANADPPKPLDIEQVLAHLKDMRGLLNQNVEKSSPLLRELTGSIVVKESDPKPPRKRKLWVARIRGDVVRFMASAAREVDCPDRATWEFLSARKWINAPAVTVMLEQSLKYEVLAKETRFVRLIQSGYTLRETSRKMQLPEDLVKDAARFLRAGIRPSSKPRLNRVRHSSTQKLIPPHILHASEIAHLREFERLSFAAIGRKLRISGGTASRGNDYHQWERQRVELECNGKIPPGPQSLSKVDRNRRIHLLKAEGASKVRIARELKCAVKTVYRVLKKLPPPKIAEPDGDGGSMD